MGPRACRGHKESTGWRALLRGSAAHGGVLSMVTSVRSTAKAQHTRGFNHCSTSSSSTHLDKVGPGLREGESQGDAQGQPRVVLDTTQLA